MTYSTQLETNLLDAVTFVVMAPLQLACGLLWLLYQCVKGITATGKAGVYAAAIIGAVVLCAACPLLPVGLAIVAAFAWATMPRKAVR